MSFGVFYFFNILCHISYPLYDGSLRQMYPHVLWWTHCTFAMHSFFSSSLGETWHATVMNGICWSTKHEVTSPWWCRKYIFCMITELPEQEAVESPLAFMGRGPGEVGDVVGIFLQSFKPTMWWNWHWWLDRFHQLRVRIGARVWTPWKW